MAAAKLRLLRISALQFIADAVEQGDVALLWILLEGGDEGPGHSAGSLSSNVRILPVKRIAVSMRLRKSTDVR